jgi:hypothetical protein
MTRAARAANVLATRLASAAVAAALAGISASCGAPLMTLPAGPGVASTDAAAALSQATAACRGVDSLTAEIAVSGSVGGRRLRGRLLAGLAAPASARLEAAAPFGQPIFIFVARNNEATLLLPRDRRVLEHGRPDAVLEAVTGVPLTPTALLTTITGCSNDRSSAVDEARDLGNGWLMIPGATRVYLRRDKPANPWRIVAALSRDAAGTEWRAEYSGFADGLPHAIRLASVEQGRFNLRLSVSQLELNVPLGAEAFEVRVDASADPISLDELRDAGPLADVQPHAR